jgi:hypothetical protein
MRVSTGGHSSHVKDCGENLLKVLARNVYHGVVTRRKKTSTQLKYSHRTKIWWKYLVESAVRILLRLVS